MHCEKIPTLKILNSNDSIEMNNTDDRDRAGLSRPGFEESGDDGFLRKAVLPNGMQIAYQSKAELTHFYDDIFVKQIYLKNGITLKEGACVFDVGANIGLFTLFAHQVCRAGALYCFEPAPPLFRILRSNALAYGVKAKLFNCGLSNRARTASFTFYPNSSGMSSFFGDEGEEGDALRSVLTNELRKSDPEMSRLMRYLPELIEHRLKSEVFECSLKTMSEIITEQGVEEIDLLKIDVQKSELDVIEGINERDWEKIRQVVLEVHDLDGRLEKARSELLRHGFQVTTEQDEMYEGSILYNLYAIRPESRVVREDNNAVTLATSYDRIQTRAERQKMAQERLKTMMRERKKES
ncbi:MAG: FkbM family methyltransferase [Blastocatellia bacterium]